jgi:pimeloyl-ACP methyl ester carboxylesterase
MPNLLKIATAVSLLFISFFTLSKSTAIDKNSIDIRIKEAMVMIQSTEPTFSAPAPMPTEQQIADMGLPQPNTYKSLSMNAKDGKKLHINLYGHKGNVSVLLLHGVASSSYTYNITAGLLRDVLKANVYTLDFRGHGQSGGVTGDVEYQNQYAHDIEDTLQFIKSRGPDDKIIVAGHSMGGGIALMHASLSKHTSVDGYVLFAPNLGAKAATMKKSEVHAENADDSFLKLHVPRIIGLYQLNLLGVNSYDHLPVMFFNMPSQYGTNQYSYRAMLSTSPEYYKKSLNVITAPVITLVGEIDEVFDAQEFPEAMEGLSNGDIHVIPGETHNGIRHSKEAMKYIHNWAKSNNLLVGEL